MSDLLALEGRPCKSKDWIRAHLDHPSADECLMWPFSRSQAGYAGIGGKHTAVHRIMCEYRNGPPPTPKHQACHSCGRGKEGCVNPNHLSWKTNAENQIERFKHSGYQPQRKLTLEQVEEIRALKGTISVQDVAAKFNVIPLTIHRIYAGKLWSADSAHNHIFSSDEILRVRASRGYKVATALAREFGVSESTIYRIRKGDAYSHIQAPTTTQMSRPVLSCPDWYCDHGRQGGCSCKDSCKAYGTSPAIVHDLPIVKEENERKRQALAQAASPLSSQQGNCK